MEQSSLTSDQSHQSNKKHKIFFKLTVIIFITMVIIFCFYFYQPKKETNINTVSSNKPINPLPTKSSKIKMSDVSGLRLYDDARLVLVQREMVDGIKEIENGLSVSKKEKITEIPIDEGVDNIVHSDTYSNDSTKILYKKLENNNNIESLYIYDTTSNSHKKIFETTEINNVLWSGDDKYLLINSGYGPIKDINVIDASGHIVKKLYGYFFSGNSPCSWIDNNSFICNQPQDIKDSKSSRIGRGIIEISLNENKEKIIKQADEFNDYMSLKYYENSLYFQKINVSNNKSTYWKMNLDGTNLIGIGEIEATI